MDLFAFDTLPEWSHEYVATPAVCAIPAKHPRRFPRILARSPGSRLRQLREVDAKMKRLESRLFPMIRGSWRYQERRDPQAAFRMRLRELAASRVYVGYRGITTLLRRDGGRVNAKRIYRHFADEGVTARNKNHSKTACPRP